MTDKSVRTRFAPSPTGFLHIGSLRTAVYAYALAKHEDGDFILRIEDTDQKREVEGSSESLQTTLQKFGIKWDEFYVQSIRHKTGIYRNAVEKLVEQGYAFYCNCKPRNAKDEGYSLELRDPCRDKNLTSGAIKLKVPDNRKVTYYDFVHRKEISWDTNTVYDATLLKSDGFPTYHLAAMVDDLDMRISHILRGHDWLPSTPIHLLVFEYLGGKRPEIGHLTDILSAQTGKKLSKRRDSVFVEQFLDEGYLPEALLNFISLLGWAPKDNRELFTLQDFVSEFEINGFQEANPRFLEDKLLWMNGEYIKKLDDKEFAKRVKKFAPESVELKKLEETALLVKTRIKKLSEFKSLGLPLFEEPVLPDEKLLEKVNKIHLEKALESLEKLDEKDWNSKLDDVLLKTVEKNGFKTGEFFMSLRIAVFSNSATPPINDSMKFIGKEKSLNRIRRLK
jgi:glutamyl-tRNA synthetase